LAKPSTLWPVDPLPTEDGRVGPSTNNPPPDPGHADQLKPSKARLEEESSAAHKDGGGESKNAEIDDPDDYDVDHWEPKPPKVQMSDPDATPLELHAQIQLYATTE
jgi:hypothetical protein